MKEWEPVSPKMPEPVVQEESQEDVDPVVEEQPEIIPKPVDEEPHSNVALSDNKSGKGMGWYVVHTYSGYENKVKANIEKAIENRHLENEILEVRVPDVYKRQRDRSAHCGTAGSGCHDASSQNDYAFYSETP